MRDAPRPVDELRRLVDGYQASQALHVLVELGLADALGDEHRPVADLARETGTNADALRRLLRALAAVGVLHEDGEERFALTELGRPLRTDAPDSLAGWAGLIGRPYYREAWSQLAHSIRTGENAFRHVHGVGVWEWRAAHPDEAANFDRAMLSLTRVDAAALLAAYDFSRFGTVVDLGGGRGGLLAAVLAASPGVQGVLLDLPHVVAGAGEVLEAAGVADRCRVVAGSFFAEVPPGGDAYLLKAILHDWEDADCIRILEVVRPALADGGRVLVLERVLPGPNEGAAAKLSDLNMLVSPGGRERTLPEYGRLFEAAGLRLDEVTPTSSGLHVVAGVAAG